jgi:hypothetical protein
LREDVAEELRTRYELDGGDLALLRCVEHRGRFAGRPVLYVRVYRLDRAQASGARIRGYNDLSLCPELVLYEGHVEEEGIYLVPRVQGMSAFPDLHVA